MSDKETIWHRAKRTGRNAWQRVCTLWKNSDACGDTGYRMTWITESIAVGYAPMSYADLDDIRGEGIDAIINLCGEFCDLHEIEEKSGFEVFYLPIPDECAPDMDEMEVALAWLDEAIYLGKKVLVHCRHGIGRTGTFVTSYLLRRGLGMKVAARTLKNTSAQPTNYSQWKLLKKYGRKSGVLKVREPSLESRNVVDLSTYFADYEAFLQIIDDEVRKSQGEHGKILKCGLETDACCFDYLNLTLIEVIYLNNAMNRTFTSELRLNTIHEAGHVFRKTENMRRRWEEGTTHDREADQSFSEIYSMERILCPLNQESMCVLFEHRPIQCRLHGFPPGAIDMNLVNKTLFDISRNVFFAFSGTFLETDTLSFSLAETVSGRFVQKYFYYLISRQNS